MRQIRENALNVARENAEKIKKQKIDTIAENKKIALKEQMKVINIFVSFFFKLINNLKFFLLA